MVGSVFAPSVPALPAASLSTGAVKKLPWVATFTAVSSASADLAGLTGWSVLAPGGWDDGETDPIMCTDLGDAGEAVVRLPCHTAAVSCTFNQAPRVSSYASSNACPSCGTKYELPGPQPSGTMDAHTDPTIPCDGHPSDGTIILVYTFPDGTQQPQHPKPGRPYHGTSRTVYLPHNDVGTRCLALLATAFHQGALFRVGSSSTTGRDDVVVWAIHQKTAPTGGPTNHGWPDDGYLERLTSECAAAGVRGALDAVGAAAIS